MQAGFIGLLIAARKWREDGGASLMTYATPWIKEHMARVLDEVGGAVRIPKEEREFRSVTRGHPLPGESPPPRTHESAFQVWTREQVTAKLAVSPKQEDALAEHQRTAIVRSVVASLPKAYRDMVMMVVVDGKTYRQVAAKFCCSPQRVCNVVRDSREEIARRLEGKLSRDDVY